MKFTIYRTWLRQWRWRLLAANGKKLASGEGYWNKGDCLHAVALVQSAGANIPVVQDGPGEERAIKLQDGPGEER